MLCLMTSQDMLGPPGCQALLTQAQLATNQDPQVPLSTLLSSFPFLSLYIWCYPSQLQSKFCMEKMEFMSRTRLYLLSPQQHSDTGNGGYGHVFSPAAQEKESFPYYNMGSIPQETALHKLLQCQVQLFFQRFIDDSGIEPDFSSLNHNYSEARIKKIRFLTIPDSINSTELYSWLHYFRSDSHKSMALWYFLPSKDLTHRSGRKLD
ncbi:hypothetical protein TURU_021587 [Turdus rufiventris]|nr:hypothetical protein TURU_021587 [Turdus rufiventris]